MTKEKIVSIEDRIPKLKQARKKKANRRLVFYLTIFFFLISIIVYLQSPLSDVKTINVSGNSFLPDKEIIEQSGIKKDTNIWTIDKEDIIHKLRRNPLINTVSVETKLPWTVEIQVVEHKRIGYIKKDNQYHPILSNGLVFSDSKKDMAGDAPLLVGFQDEKALMEMSKELSKLPVNIFNLISELHWTPSDKNKNAITLYMTDGFMVESSIRNFAEKMSVYPSIVTQLDPAMEGIIHIGVGAYFEPFNKELTDDEKLMNENVE
ncbi:cell division protein FtsQ/DivIB [Ornithinibacillus bavariensis]|uniref:Cell division protein DivIB n=1 Tax=Ornithinibacillus bavariensis TaxID=545502 RepID=A0A920C6V3_9BACI|nr:cell division protein FtsQ/DivIB [Ornithinibacillus bavariensis]GIO26067.1 cell division protein DivIB [Ornithinibacillus bavariensis]